MRNIFIALGMMAVAPVAAQVGVEKTDSFEMGATYLNDVYYSLLDGDKHIQPTNNWHVAFSVGTFTAGVRVNTATATGANNGNTNAYVNPNGAIADWANFDTSDMLNWKPLNNSDEYWEEGALNTTAGAFPDYGWGIYKPDQNHAVLGDSMYLITYVYQGNTISKKFAIVKKDMGNWIIKFANLDGSDEHADTLKSSEHGGKLFIYYNFETKAEVDREPAAWDFVQTRYNAWQPNNTYAAATGILTNEGVYTAVAEGKDADSLQLADSVRGFDESLINAIGYEWKYYVMNPDFSVVWFTVDSQAYFIQDLNGILWKVVFTAFGGSGNGKTVFNKTQVTPGTSIRGTEAPIMQTALYPNPTQGKTQLVITSESNTNAAINVLDINGKVVYSTEINQAAGMQVVNLDLNHLTQGVYFVNIWGEGFKSTQKLIKH